jgi:hypothetical protein
MKERRSAVPGRPVPAARRDPVVVERSANAKAAEEATRRGGADLQRSQNTPAPPDEEIRGLVDEVRRLRELLMRVLSRAGDTCPFCGSDRRILGSNLGPIEFPHAKDCPWPTLELEARTSRL